MLGPGAYRPDPTEGITAIADLPPPEIIPLSRNDKRQPCPRCGHSAYRDKQFQRMLHDLGNLDLWCPRERVVTYAQHYCTKWHTYFQADLSDLAPPGRQYTHRVIELAVRLSVALSYPPNRLDPVDGQCAVVELSGEDGDQVPHIPCIGSWPQRLEFFPGLLVDIDVSCLLNQHHGDVTTIFRHRKNVVISVCCERRFEFV